MVYHYTTIESFYSMLAKYKASEDKENLVFWASNVLNQNDSEEMSLRLSDIISTVEKLEQEKPELSELQKLSTVKEYEWLFGHTSEKIEEDINAYCTDINHTPYTISFSHQCDVLLMWSMYASNGTGLCLAFDESKIQKKQPHLYMIPDNVFYENDPEYYINVVSVLYEIYLKEQKECVYIDGLERKKGVFLSTMLSGIAPFIKNKAFKDEQEFRLAYYKFEKEEPKVFTRLTNRLNVINYIEIPIPIEALQHIVIGPCADYEKAKKLLVDNM